jgi:hypothetical protein
VDPGAHQRALDAIAPIAQLADGGAELAPRRQLSGTQIAPILAMAKKLSMYSTLFICSSATRSPFATPSRRRKWAVRLARAFHSGKVKRRFV